MMMKKVTKAMKTKNDNKTSLKALYTGTFEEGDDDDEESYEGNEDEEESGEFEIEIIQFDLLNIFR